MTAVVSTCRAEVLARANWWSPLWESVPEYMSPPYVRHVSGEKGEFVVRVWRARPIPNPVFRRTVGMAECTHLDNGVVTGLVWKYSRTDPVLYPTWARWKYVLHGWYPGDQPCRDLHDVYHSCTLEIRWLLKCLRTASPAARRAAP